MAARLASLLRCSSALRGSFMSTSRLSQSSAFHTTNYRLNEFIINIQDEEDYKQRVLQSETPVIVDFHATWCGPCKILGPRLEALVSAENGKVILAKVDVDDLPDIAMDHGVEAVPSVFSIFNGTIKNKLIGLKDDDELKIFIRNVVLKPENV